MRASTLTFVGEQDVDGRGVARARRDVEDRVAVGIDGIRIDAAGEEALDRVRAIVDDGDDEVVVELLRPRERRKRQAENGGECDGGGAEERAAINGHLGRS